MSLRSFHIAFISSALVLLAFLLYWAGERYVREGAAQSLPLALSAAAGLALGLPYLRWFSTRRTTLR